MLELTVGVGAIPGNPLLDFTMAAQSITTEHYKLFPSPRNRHRTIFLHQVFVPHSYMLIDMESYQLKGKYSLFGACLLYTSDAADE